MPPRRFDDDIVIYVFVDAAKRRGYQYSGVHICTLAIALYAIYFYAATKCSSNIFVLEVLARNEALLRDTPTSQTQLKYRDTTACLLPAFYARNFPYFHIRFFKADTRRMPR